MFRFLKPDPSKKLRKHYEAKLNQAMLAQRNGDIRRYSELTEEAESLNQQLNELEKSARNNRKE